MTDFKQTYTLQAKYEGKGELGQLNRDLAALGKIESIRKLGGDVRDLTVRFNEAQKKLVAQAREMKSADTVTKEMTAAYKSAQREVERLATSLEKKKAAFRGATAAAKDSGVNTKSLAAEEKRLAIASEQTGKIWAARQALGVKSHKDIREEVQRLRVAYETLQRSGKASVGELMAAKQQLNSKTRELNTATGVWAGTMNKAYTSALALAGAGYAVLKVFKEYAAFETGMAEINTLLDISKERFIALKKETAGVSADLTQDTGDLTKSLYDIISSGVALEDSTKVLELSAKAATAGVTETKTAVNVGVGAMNAYGQSVDELESIYDVLFQTVKLGVTTFPELSQNMGDVLPTARSANVGLKEVSAAIAAMTLVGIKTPKAATALTGAIRAMAAPAPEAKKKFDELGITWDGLIPTLEQIAEKSLSIDQMRLLIPDVEASTGVLAMTQNLDKLKEILGSMDGAAGATQEAYKKMADTPNHEIKLMVKALSEAGISLGQLASMVILPTAQGIKFLVNAINESPAPIKLFISLIGAAATGVALWRLGLGTIAGAIGDTIAILYKGAAATGAFTSGIAGARAGVASLTAFAAANPVIAGLTAVVLLGAAAWTLFGKNALESSQAHGEAAEKIGAARKETDAQIASLKSLRQTLQNTAPDSEAHLEAERELAKILPTANLSLDEHGRMIAKVGDAASENSKKLDEYLVSLKAESMQSFALQLEQQAKALNDGSKAVDDYKQNLQQWYGIGQQSTSIIQDFWRGVNRLTGTYDQNIAKGEEVRGNLGKQKQAYGDLLQSMASAGVSAGELEQALNEMHMEAELKGAVLDDYKELTNRMKEVSDAAAESGDKQKASFREVTEDAKQQYKSLADEVKSILDEIAGRQQSLSEQLRDIGRSGMSDFDAWNDLKNEAEEYETAAKNAAAAGNFDAAVQLADTARAKFAELSAQVKDGDQVLISQEEALATKMEGVQRNGELAIEIQKKLAEEAKATANALNAETGGQLANQMQEEAKIVGDTITGLSEKMATLAENVGKKGSEALDSLAGEIKDVTDKTYIIKFKAEKIGKWPDGEGKQAGGLIGARMMLGGLLGPALKLAGGGNIFRNMLAGGWFPGFGGGDRRHVVAEDGEYMLDKYRVRDAGLRTVQAFHAGRYDIVVAELLKRMRMHTADVLSRKLGGIIDSMPQVAAAGPQYLADGGSVTGTTAGSGGGLFNITLNYSGSGSRSDASAMAKLVMAELQRMNRRAS